MTRRLSIRLLLLITGLSLIAPGALAQPKYTISAGVTGGMWNTIAAAIGEGFRQDIGIATTVVPGTTLANVIRVSEGKAELAIGQDSRLFEAWNGAGDFTNRQIRNIRGIAVLFPQYAQLVVRADSGIKSVQDLKGQLLATAPKGSDGERQALRMLEVNGIRYEDLKKVIHTNYADAVNQMRDGHVNAVVIATTIPTSAIVDLSLTREIALVPLSREAIERLVRDHGYVALPVPKATYRGVDVDVPGIGSPAVLFARTDLPDDTVYRLTKSLFDRRETLTNVAKIMSALNPSTSVRITSIPLHPGAERYYREQGAR